LEFEPRHAKLENVQTGVKNVVPSPFKKKVQFLLPEPINVDDTATLKNAENRKPSVVAAAVAALAAAAV
jgi:hypothetical protein